MAVLFSFVSRAFSGLSSFHTGIGDALVSDRYCPAPLFCKEAMFPLLRRSTICFRTRGSCRPR